MYLKRCSLSSQTDNLSVATSTSIRASVEVKEALIERILGFGRVLVRDNGGTGTAPFKYLKNPKDLSRAHQQFLADRCFTCFIEARKPLEQMHLRTRLIWVFSKRTGSKAKFDRAITSLVTFTNQSHNSVR